MLTLNRGENPKRKGFERDKKIILALEQFGALDTQQVQVLFFSNIPYGQRKAQQRLLLLYQRGKIYRKKQNEEPYCYFLGNKPPGMVRHLLACNWVRIWHQKNIAGWEKLHCWSYEQDFKILRCDGFSVVKNTMTGKFRFTFIELDRATNAFDKVVKYNKLFERQELLEGRWWYPLTEVFPTIQVVTVHPTRKRLIQREIQGSNKNNLRFDVCLLDELKREVMSKCTSITLPSPEDQNINPPEPMP